MFNSLKLGTKIRLGFALITLVLVIAVLTTITQIGRFSSVVSRITDLRAPTAQSSLMILNGMNHSLAALRGWIILGNESMKTEREFAWNDEIESSIQNLNSLSTSWTNPDNVRRLKFIESQLNDFKKFQQEIEDIAHQINNVPATKILFEQAAPQADILANNITRMIDLEMELAATPERKAVLGMMADVRGTTGLSLAAIRAYLLSGDETFKGRFETLWTKNTRRFGDLSNNINLLTNQQRVAFDKFSAARAIFDPLPSMMFEIRGGEEWNLANRWLKTKAAPIAAVIVGELNSMVADQQQLMASDMEISRNLASSLSILQWVILFAGIVLSLVGGLIITRSITKPINLIISRMNDGAEQVNSASDQVASSSMQMAEGATEQAASLEEISASLEETASMTRLNSVNAQEAHSLANQSKEAAESGNLAVGRMTLAVDKIKSSADETAKIVKTIDEIAFQTNLLALNAAVEAARAGEAGKGFAVVAEEVRNLASRSAIAAKDTAQLINESQQNAEEGVSVSMEVAEILTKMVGQADKVSALVAEISTASDEQTSGVDQINTAVAEVNTVTQNNAANAEESAGASEQLNAQATELNQAVAFLAQIVGSSDKSANNTPMRQKAMTSSQSYSIDTKQYGQNKGNILPKNKNTTVNTVVDREAVIPLADSELEDF